MWSPIVERPVWRTFDVPHRLDLYRLVPPFQDAIEHSGGMLEEGRIVRMGVPWCKNVYWESHVVIDVAIDGATYFVLVRDISDHMSDLNSMYIRALGRMSLVAIYDALWKHSFGAFKYVR